MRRVHLDVSCRPFGGSAGDTSRVSADRVLVVDAANVVGSRPDGWWRDRAGAAARLRDGLVDVAGSGVVGEDGPPLLPPVEVVLVVEGRARGVEPVPGVRVVAARGSGDDAIVDLVAALRGPGWLLRALDR
jgi:hypothetical protein